MEFVKPTEDEEIINSCSKIRKWSKSHQYLDNWKQTGKQQFIPAPTVSYERSAKIGKRQMPKAVNQSNLALSYNCS